VTQEPRAWHRPRVTEGLRIRRFAEPDRNRVCDVFRAAVLEIDPASYSAEQRTAWVQRSAPGELAERCAAGWTWVAERADEVIGFMTCEDDGHVDLAFVHPLQQGLGVARALYAELEREARRQRLGRLFVEASVAARPFFERAGFAVRARNAVRLGDQVLSNWSMNKRLFPPEAARRVFVIGNSGSGKTSLAKQLADDLGRPRVDLDEVAFSDQLGTRRPVVESIELLRSTAALDARAVIEGCYADLVAALAGEEDHIMWLDLPISACVENARSRPWEPHKWPSAEAQDAFLPNLIAFIESYPSNPTPTGRPAHRALFREFPGVREVHRARPLRPESLSERR